jgi:hypothetical protein
MSGYDPNDALNQLQDVYSHYSDSRGSKEYDNSFQASEEIGEIMKEVRDSVTPDASFGAKVKAIRVILQISNEVIEEGGSTLASEIRKQFYNLPVGSAVTHIFNMLSPEELAALQADGALADELIAARQVAETRMRMKSKKRMSDDCGALTVRNAVRIRLFHPSRFACCVKSVISTFQDVRCTRRASSKSALIRVLSEAVPSALACQGHKQASERALLGSPSFHQSECSPAVISSTPTFVSG